jgi:alpha-tubulin suppressor-like RCC1 family protein
VDQAARAAKPAGVQGARPQASALGDNGAYSPAYLQSAYNAPSSAEGTGKTVALVDVYDDPNAESDLAVYRSHYGLPPCTTANGCFQKVDETGGNSYPAPDGGWALEISLDLDMVSAMCPNCHILLIEANAGSFSCGSESDLTMAEDEAISLGADAVSNSWTTPCDDDRHEPLLNQHFEHPGVAITAGSGDFGYGNLGFPAADPGVTAVGGTTLQQATDTGTRNATETAWAGSGSGCSWAEPKPSWQHDSGCPMRSVADVAAVADPSTPVWVYDTYPYNGNIPNWTGVGGTSASSPIVASIYALASGPSGAYTPAGYPYAQTGHLNDVTSGGPSYGCSTGSYLCQAKPGYDGLTGFGTPNGIRAFQPSVPSPPQDLTAGSFGGTTVLSWSQPSTNGGAAVSAYHIYRADQGGSPIASLGSSATSYTDTGLTNGTTYDYTLKAVNPVGEGDGSLASATPDPLDHLVVSPVSPTIEANAKQGFTVHGFDASNDPLGDETVAASFSIDPDGSCTGATCTATTAGDHTVMATLSGKIGSASLHVDAGPLEALALSPTDATIVAGDSQGYSASGLDGFNNLLGSETAHSLFSIDPDGSCIASACSASVDGDHTVTGRLKYASVASGGPSGCAVTVLGGLRCWGYDNFGALGNPDVPACDSQYPLQRCSAVPVPVSGLSSGVASVSAGFSSACAVTTTGGAKCWGWNFNGWLGNGSTRNSDVPEDVYGLASGVAAISTVFGHTCALSTGGGVKCWGGNEYGPGDLGDGSGYDSFVPIDVSGLTSGASAVSAGVGFTCALTMGGGVKCWGTDNFGQLGDGGASTCFPNFPPSWPCSPTPVDVSGLTSGVAAITTGYGHACALTTGGGVKCWGENLYGDLGDGETSNHCNPNWDPDGGPPCSSVPVQVSGLTSGVAAVSAGYHYTCAVMNVGGVKCWGSNAGGQFGNGTTTDSDVPVDVAGITNAVAVSAGPGYPCALLATGIVKCWSQGSGVLLGDGTVGGSLVPVEVLSYDATAALHVGPPQTTIDSGPSGLTNDPATAFAFHSNEAGSTFECRLDSSQDLDWQPCSSPQDYGLLSDGAHTFEVRATHSTTGTDLTPASRSFTIDTTQPAITISFGPSGPTNIRQPQFNFDYINSDVVPPPLCSIDHGTPSFSACSGAHSHVAWPPLADGSYTFRVRVADTAGNENTVTRDFSVDTVRPTVKIASLRVSHAKHRARIAFKANEPATFKCRLDGHQLKRCTSPIVYTGLKTGKHYFLVRGTDLAGNYRYAKTSFTI